jgi:asparagine synthase (glutamine-hydrolysing)
VCGICGFTHANKGPSPALIRRMTSSIIHRGPDQQGTYESEHISLGAVRLRIIDLTGGDQPFSSEDGETIVVFNGEIYNHYELRRELEQSGHHLRTSCDTELVLGAFLKWDVGCFARLRGMFAIAVWCESQQRLVLARDRMGIKPLYVRRTRTNLHFGSELKAILADPDIERQIDLEGLSHYLSLNYVPAPRTLVSGIEKLPAAHWLEWRRSRIRIERYWYPKVDLRPGLHMREAQEELDHLLRQSVREHLASDVPLGIFISGGVDSSLILHYAAEISSMPLRTFSISFLGHRHDESRHARALASHYGTQHEEFDLNPSADLTGAINSMSHHSDEPGADAGALPIWFLSALARKQVTVALSGDGADELFGGYQTYLADHYTRYLRLFPAPLRRAGLSLFRHWPVSDAKISFEYKLKRFVHGSLLTPEDAHLFWNGMFSIEEKQRLCTFEHHPDLADLYGQIAAESAPSGLHRFMHLDQQFYLCDDILYKCDRMSMAHSLEVRPPFLDHRIVEFAGGLPENLHVRGPRLKILLRSLLATILPASMVSTRKEGLDIPVHAWLRGPLRDLLLDVLSPRRVRASQIFNPAMLQELIDDHLERRVNAGYHLWGLLTLFLWMERWGIHPSSSSWSERARSDELPDMEPSVAATHHSA